MRGLHNIRTPAPPMTWRWYSAFQTRRGRRHLIHVPLAEVDLNDFISVEHRRVPYAIRYLNTRDRQIWAERGNREGRNLFFPNNVNPDAVDTEGQRVHTATRFCTGTQAARYYRYEPTAWSREGVARPRGYCETCWNNWMAHNSPMRASIRETALAAPIGYLNMNQARWEEIGRRDFRPS